VGRSRFGFDRNRLEVDHLVTAYRVQDRRKAPVDQAMKDWAVHLHVTDALGALDPAGGWKTDETDLDSSGRHFFVHGLQVGGRSRPPTSAETLSEYPAGRCW
jgi:hypothetical protein